MCGYIVHQCQVLQYRSSRQCFMLANGNNMENPAGVLFFIFFLSFNYHLYFPASLVRCFILNKLLDKPWSQVGVYPFIPPPPVRAFFLSRVGFSIPPARRFSSNVAHSRSRAFRINFSSKKKSLRASTRRDLNPQKNDIDRLEDHLPSHRGRRL